MRQRIRTRATAQRRGQPDTGAVDAVDLLLRQHQRIRQLFDKVETATEVERETAFRQLVRLLAIHETVEEEVVHPRARDVLDDGDVFVDAWLGEEFSAKETLARLERTRGGTREFEQGLRELRRDVEGHAKEEETIEFPALKTLPAHQMARLTRAVRAAMALAPTHPHPGMEKPMPSLLFGTPVAVLDRARDALHDAVRHSRTATWG